jgi:glutamyl-tRNA synthetase
VPLALNTGGRRLAKRDGAVTLGELLARGRTARQVCGVLAASLGLAEPGAPVRPADLLSRFDPMQLPREPWIVEPALL